MMIKTTPEMKSRVLIAAVLGLLSQSAWSDQGQAATSALPEVRVTAPRQKIEIADLKISTDAQGYIEALNRRLAEDLAKDLEAIRASRVELVIAEVPTRG
jgi:hypothetical protein